MFLASLPLAMSLKFSDDPYLTPAQRPSPVVDMETYRMARSLSNPRVPVTWLLLAANLAAALVMTLHLGWAPDEGRMLDYLVAAGANRRAEILGAREYWRLLASAFLHVGWLHLLLNLYALKILGQLVENLFGPLRLWLLYLGGAVGGSLASVLTTLATRPEMVSAGASGAIFGLLGAVLVFYLRCRERIPPALRKYFFQFFVVLALNIYLGMRIPVVDNSAHLGGLAGGALFTLIMMRGRQAGLVTRKAGTILAWALAGLGLYPLFVMASRWW